MCPIYFGQQISSYSLTRREGLPLSVLEVQATKVPVLAAPTAGIPEVITDGETGFLISADDAIGYANGIEKLLNHSEISRYI